MLKKYIHPEIKQFISKASIACLLMFAAFQPGWAQINKYQAYFDEAYQKYPTIPRGVLEAVAYTNTRMQHVQPKAGCQGLPEYYGVMGLVGDGKGYFQNSLQQVARLSGYSIEEIARSPRINILAYAAAYASVQQNKRMTSRSVEGHKPVLRELTEIPSDGSLTNDYALNQQFYSVLIEMQNPHTGTNNRTRQLFNFEQIFGAENYRVLSASWVKMSNQRVRNTDGDNFELDSRVSNCSPQKKQADYRGAIWNEAHTNNYGSRNGEKVEFITIHTVQGSYASAISWFKNRNARVSAHYVIRASDGQVTQMVCEDDKAYHVRTDNATAIGIEHEGFIDDGGAWYTNEMYESSAALVRDICKRRGINPLQTFGGPPTRGVMELGNKCWKVKGHQHFRGNDHIDPGPYWDWERYYRLINPEPKPILITDRKGEIYDSGGANGNYQNQERTTYLIKPDNASSVQLTFKSFELEGTTQRPYDYLDIYDGENVNGLYLGRFTGNQRPPDIISKTGSIFMEFRSDCGDTFKGWHISYNSRRKNPDCEAPTDLLASNTFPMGVTLSWKSVNKADQYLVVLKRKLENKGVLYRLRNTSFTVTGLSANGLYQWQVQAVCGRDTSAVVGDAFITPNVARGDNPQIYTVTLNRGRFHDSGGTFSGYSDNENYLYRIIPPDGRQVELTFSEFETEEALDVLTIYDGKSTSGKKLGTYSGKKLPPKILSSGNGLTLHFTSDNRTTAKGWQASWRGVSSGSGGVVDNSGNTNTGNNTNTGGNTSPPSTDPVVDDGPFDPGDIFHRYAPETNPELKDSYSGTFSLSFEDRDRSGRGLANRFYNISQVEEATGGFRSNPQAGFFYDDFNAGRHGSWKSASGNWQVSNGRMVQTNTTIGNSNLYTSLYQTGSEVYVYHWKAKMEGNTKNLRHGIHFFSNKPANEDRGTSYFIWIRDTDRGDFVEIYKTVNDQFDRKIQKSISLETGKVYDYKTIYNPRKGRIEVYVNNVFKASWVDPYPLKSGNGLSLRTGNAKVTYDDLIVYQARGSSVRVQVDAGSRSELSGNGRFKVSSLIVDRRIRWSKVGEGISMLGSGSSSNTSANSGSSGNNSGSDNSGPSSGSGNSTNTDAEPPSSNSGVQNNDFDLAIGSGRGKHFYLPTDYNGKLWTANSLLGFAVDDFDESRVRADWNEVSGNWKIVGQATNKVLQQTDVNVGNSNIYLPLEQNGKSIYLYHWKARILTEGDNKRFGLHFFCSDGKLTNRGNSYLVWFRNYDSPHQNGQDKVEIYRSDNDQLPRFRDSKFISIKSKEWYDCKLVYDPIVGKIDVYLNNSKVLSWEDDLASLQNGNAISFRTGDSQVEIDALRVYKQSNENKTRITVGGEMDMIRFKSIGNKPAARIYSITLSDSNVWSAVKEEEVQIK